MAKGKQIVLSVGPKGVYVEGTAEGSVSPGEAIAIDAAVEPVSGRHTWQAASVGDADGARALICIAYNSGLDGKTNADAVADGERVYGYCPNPGEELNVLVKASVGALAIGDLLIQEAASGQFIATTGTPEQEPFQVMETITVGGTATLVHVIYTGH